VRNRSKITKGPGSRAAGIAMAYKLIEAAQSRLRAVNAPTWSPSSAPEPNSRTANPSNDPTNQEVKIKPRNTPIHRCCLLPVEDCALPCLTEQAKSRCYS
jgi:hypothetical protein